MCPHAQGATRRASRRRLRQGSGNVGVRCSWRSLVAVGWPALYYRSNRPEGAKPAAFRIMSLPAIPIIDIRDGGPLDHARQNAEQAPALRDACLEFFPAAA